MVYCTSQPMTHTTTALASVSTRGMASIISDRLCSSWENTRPLKAYIRAAAMTMVTK